MRKGLALALAVGLTVSALTGPGFASAEVAAAEEASAAEEDVAAVSALEEYSDVCVNPLYADVLTGDGLLAPEAADSAAAAASVYNETEYLSAAADLAPAVKAAMLSRTESVTLYIEMDTYTKDVIDEKLDDIFECVFVHTGVPTEGDYLRWQYAGWTWNTTGTKSDGTYYVTLSLTITYYTTAAQEAELDAAVASLVSQLGLDSMSDDYRKGKAIYDWICANVTYDYTNLNDSDYTLKYTAYAALVNKTAICQVYANLFYRLALECGVDTRLIFGTAGSTNHTWNIVKLGGYYYNIDATWDATLQQAGGNYRYFLLCPDSFTGHTRGDDYTTDAFNEAWPMASADYTPDGLLYGDVNGDNAVDSLDAALVLMYAEKQIDDGALITIAADVSGDDLIDARDASLILLLDAGVIDAFAAE